MPLGRMLRRMKLVPVVWIAAAMWLTAAPFAHGEETSVPLSEVLARVKASVATQCAGHRATLARTDASLFSLEQARDGVEVTCSCFPQELDKESRSPQDASGTVEQRAETMARNSIEACVLRRMRSRFPEACRQDTQKIPDPQAREAYCRCVESGISKLADQEVIAAILKARQSFEARVAAASKGEPAPPLALGPFSDIETACSSRAPEEAR